MLVQDLEPTLIRPAALACSALLLSPTSRDPDPPSRPLSVLLLLGISLAALDLGLSALRRADSSLDICPHVDHLTRQRDPRSHSHLRLLQCCVHMQGNTAGQVGADCLL